MTVTWSFLNMAVVSTPLGRFLFAMSAADHRFWRSAALPFVEARRASASRNSYIPHAHDSLSIGSVEGGESAFSLRDVERDFLD